MELDTILEYLLIGIWFVLGWVNSAFSFTSGTVIFYLFQIDRDEEDFSLLYFTLLIGVSLIGGHYLRELLPLLVDAKYSDALAPINFFLGLISKLVLDIVLTNKFFKQAFQKPRDK